MTTAVAELIGMGYSPWTEKARWALDHHAIPYRYTEHFLMFGMIPARLKLRMPMREITFPALIDGEARLVDSLRIARHAEARGTGSRLFPLGRESEIERWNEVSETAADAIRALVAARVGRDKEAQVEALPPLVPAPLRRPMSAMAGIAIAYLDRHFDMSARSLEQRTQDLRGALLELRGGLARSGGRHLLGELSFADIAMAVALQGVAPVADEYLPLAPATRRAWTHEELCAEFSDLVAWRDSLYSAHRRRRSG